MELVMAFSMGLLGSLHCIGMCGPLALALPLGNLNNKLAGRILYNAGRILTYTLAGFLFGLFGKGLAVAGLQQIVSIVLGITILLAVFINSSLFQKFNPASFIYQLAGNLKSSLRKLIRVSSYPSLFGIGLINGLLPCGLVYLALAASISTGNAFQGAVFMFAFGLGTLPLMLAVTFVSTIAKHSSFSKMKNIIPSVMLIVGVLLIIRGLNAGIPYLSPEINTKNEAVHKCH
jgi:sulfite exporter TauE/SafE